MVTNSCILLICFFTPWQLQNPECVRGRDRQVENVLFVHLGLLGYHKASQSIALKLESFAEPKGKFLSVARLLGEWTGQTYSLRSADLEFISNQERLPLISLMHSAKFEETVCIIILGKSNDSWWVFNGRTGSVEVIAKERFLREWSGSVVAPVAASRWPWIASGVVAMLILSRIVFKNYLVGKWS